MTILNPTIRNADIIPTVETDIFVHQPNSRFAVGILAVNDRVVVGNEDIYRGYYDLRVGTYLHQTNQLSTEDIAVDGTDRDADDARSVAFGIVENAGTQRLVGTMRLIIKGSQTEQDGSLDSPLPVEQDWPELFVSKPAINGSLEVSRLIARHEDPRIQEATKFMLYAAGMAYAVENKLGPAYAIVESWFARDLARTVPVERIGQPKYVEKYLDDNLPLKIDLNVYSAMLEQRHPGMLAAMKSQAGDMTYYDQRGHLVVTD